MKTYHLPALFLISCFLLCCTKDQPINLAPTGVSTSRGLCDLDVTIDIGTRSSLTEFDFSKGISLEDSDLILSDITGTIAEELCAYSLTGSGYIQLQTNSSEQLIISAATASPSETSEIFDLEEVESIMIDNIGGKLNFIGTIDIRGAYTLYIPLDEGVKIRVDATAQTFEFRY